MVTMMRLKMCLVTASLTLASVVLVQTASQEAKQQTQYLPTPLKIIEQEPLRSGTVYISSTSPEESNTSPTSTPETHLGSAQPKLSSTGHSWDTNTNDTTPEDVNIWKESSGSKEADSWEFSVNANELFESPDQGREIFLNSDRHINFITDFIKTLEAKFISITNPFILLQESPSNADKQTPETNNTESYPELNNSDTVNISRILSFSAGPLRENHSTDPLTEEPNLSTEPKFFSSSTNNTERPLINSPLTTTLTTGMPPGSTSESPKPSFPLCCPEGQDESSCLTQFSREFSNSYIPVSFGRCKVPEKYQFAHYHARQIACPLSNLRKINLDDKRKILYTKDQLSLSLDQGLVSDFCIEKESGSNSELRAVFCYTNSTASVVESCTNSWCLRKCCPDGHVLQNSQCVCQEASPSLPVTFRQLLQDTGLSNVDKNTVKQVKVGLPHCGKSESTYTDSISSSERNNYKFLPNGSVVVLNHESPSRDYCVDQGVEEEEEAANGRKEGGRRTIFMLCFNQEKSKQQQQSTWKLVRRVLIPSGLVISCVFLLATLICILCVPPLRDLHGLCLAAYVGALLVADATLFLSQNVAHVLSPSACISVAIVLHVSFLSTFFWLNVICYDVWKYVGLTLQAVPLYGSRPSPGDLTHFFIYGTYAWGSPMVIGIVTIIIHSLPQHSDWILKPDFVHNSCWFRDGVEILAYFYGPMGVLCLANTLFICHTGLRLYFTDKKCDCLFGSCKRNDHSLYRTRVTEFWQRFTLFTVMVVGWVMEFISWLVGPADSELWALSDTLNAFQGVFIFMIFLRSSKKRKLLQLILERWLEKTDSSSTHLPPAHVTPSHLLSRIKNSTIWETIARRFSRISCGRSPHTTQQVMDNIIFKSNMENTRGLNNEGYEDETADAETDAKRSVCSDSPVNKSFNPIWTVPHWKSHWSQSYFPNVLNTSSHSGEERQKEELTCEHMKDSVSLYSTDVQEPSLSYTPLDEQRPIFANWNLMRNKTGSLTLTTSEEDILRGNKVVCQGLTRTDSFKKK